MPITDVNYLAVIAATLATMLLGMAWYAPPVLGKVWMRETGMTPEKAQKNMWSGLMIGTLGNLLLSFFLSILLLMVRPGSLQASMLFGVVLWLGIVVPVELSGVAWERRSWTLFLINAGWSLLSMIVITAILYGWPW